MPVIRGGLKRLRCAVAIAPAVVMWCATARAAVYAYSRQETSGYHITGGLIGILTSNVSSSAVQTAQPSGFEAHTGIVDADQSYVGPPGTRPVENMLNSKGMTTPDYSRGDALALGNGVITTANVAELYLTTPGNASAAGSWSLSGPFTVSIAGPASLSFNFLNILTVESTGPAGDTVQANYSYNLSLHDAAGAVVFTSSPTQLVQSVSLFSAGSKDLQTAGTLAITTGTLGPGMYTITLSGTENVFGNLVPEPAGGTLFGFCLAGLLRCRRPVRRASGRQATH